MRDRTLTALLVWEDCEAEEGEQLRLALDGYKVARAHDFDEARKQMTEDPPDLVFVDGDASATAEELACLVASNRRFASIPVLAVELRAHDPFGEQPLHPA